MYANKIKKTIFFFLPFFLLSCEKGRVESVEISYEEKALPMYVGDTLRAVVIVKATEDFTYTVGWEADNLEVVELQLDEKETKKAVIIAKSVGESSVTAFVGKKQDTFVVKVVEKATVDRKM